MGADSYTLNPGIKLDYPKKSCVTLIHDLLLLFLFVSTNWNWWLIFNHQATDRNTIIHLSSIQYIYYTYTHIFIYVCIHFNFYYNIIFRNNRHFCQNIFNFPESVTMWPWLSNMSPLCKPLVTQIIICLIICFWVAFTVPILSIILCICFNELIYHSFFPLF